jgi:hypothetical protein
MSMRPIVAGNLSLVKGAGPPRVVKVLGYKDLPTILFSMR